MRDLLLILLAMAVIPLAWFLWDILKIFIRIIFNYFKHRHYKVSFYWRALVIGGKRSLGGMIVALIIVGGLYLLLRMDTNNVNRQEVIRQQELIEVLRLSQLEITKAINQKDTDLVDAINKQTEAILKAIQQVGGQNVSGNISPAK